MMSLKASRDLPRNGRISLVELRVFGRWLASSFGSTAPIILNFLHIRTISCLWANILHSLHVATPKRVEI